MRKVLVTALLMLLLSVVWVTVSASFGEISYKADDGFVVFSDGVGQCDSFGFAISDGERIIHLYNVGGNCNRPYAAKINGLTSAETEIRQFTCTDGVFSYGTPIYVTNGQTVISLNEIKSGLYTELKTAVNAELYRESERIAIERIISEAESKIDSSVRKYDAEAAVNTAKAELVLLKTDAQYKAEELVVFKSASISEINVFANKSLYREAEQKKIDEIVGKAIETINSAETKEIVESSVNEAKNLILLLKTDAEYYAEELSDLKERSVLEIRSFADKTLYREAEQIKIDEIVNGSVETINSATAKETVLAAVQDAKDLISALKTDAEYYEEELSDAKAAAITEISNYLDIALYREAEQLEIETIISESISLINSRTDINDVGTDVQNTKKLLGSIMTEAELTGNAELNVEVAKYLRKAVTELEATRFVGKEKKIMNIVLPIMKEVIADGEYGRIVITPEYVKGAYPEDIPKVRSLYDSMESDIEKPAFEQKLAQLDMETQAFLKEYFL